MKSFVDKIVILSACKGKDKLLDAYNTDILRNRLKQLKIPFKTVLGCYKGESEYSVLCVVDHESQVAILKDTAFQMFNQESVLIRDQDSSAHLVFRDDTREYVGQFVSVPKDIAIRSDSYTLDKNTYWVTRK